MKTLTVSQENFKKGLQVLQDDSRADFGSARKMLNVMISDRGGITSRPGTQLIGEYQNFGGSVRSLYNFKKSKGNPDILLRTYDDAVEFFHPTLKQWALLKEGFTPDQEFGFTYSLVNVDNDDFTYFCNRYEEYQRWSGAIAITQGALAGGETAIHVDSVLQTPIYLAETATSNSSTTVTVAGDTWATDMWKNFYVFFPGTGKVRLITGNTGDTITFSTLGAGPGDVAFQIRQLAFPATGTIIYNGTNIDYTGIDVATAFIVVSAHAAPNQTPLAIIPEEFIAAPRGNRMDTLKGRVFVGRVRSAISRDAAGAIQASTQAGSEFVAKLLDPTDFSFSAPRLAGEGDILNIAYGGGDITDTKAFEDEMAIYKKDYIETVTYTDDINDTATRTPQKTGIGSVARVIKGSDDHYFMTPDKRYTSLGRVKQVDQTPQSTNLGYVIKRLLDQYNNEEFNGIEFNNRIISVHRQSDDSNSNDVMLLYNKQTKSFEGIWSIGGNGFENFLEVGENSSELIFGESNGSNVWKMFQDRKSDVRSSGEVLPFTALWQSNFFNVLPLKSNVQGICSLAIEGYIKGGTTFTFKLFKNFEDESSLSFDFSGSDTDDQLFLQGSDFSSFFGAHPFATDSIIGSFGDIENDGRRRFSFIVYFPYIYAQYLSTYFSSSGKDQDWEIIRIALGLKESISTRTTNTKTV